MLNVQTFIRVHDKDGKRNGLDALPSDRVEGREIVVDTVRGQMDVGMVWGRSDDAIISSLDNNLLWDTPVLGGEDHTHGRNGRIVVVGRQIDDDVCSRLRQQRKGIRCLASFKSVEGCLGLAHEELGILSRR